MIPHIPVSTFKTICRTCLMTKENCSMFEVNCGSMSICQMLEQYTGIHIEETEEVMPTNICQNCIELLCISFEFFETCKSSEEVLKKSLEKELREKAESQLVEEDIVVTERIILQFESDDDSDGEIYTDQDTELYNCEIPVDDNEDCQMDSQDDCKSENQDDYKLENQDEYKLENQDDCKLENQDQYKLENQYEYKLENQDKIEDDSKMQQSEDYNMENFVVSTIIEEDVKEDIHLECLHCKTSFNNYKVYDTHLRKRNKQCTICRLDFQCDVLLVRHFRSNVHREMTAKKKNNGLCIPCDQLFDDHQDFVKHFHAQHNGEQKCIHCMQPIRDVNEHLETHNRLRKVGVGRKICEICGKDVSNGYYNLHIKAHNEEDRFVCKICGNKFKYANNLRRHEKIHNGHYTLCPHCGKEFTAAHSLKSHIEHIHGITEDEAERNALICETCGCLCTNKIDLRKHIARSHGARADRTPTCFVCRRRFQTRDDLAKHKEIHQRYECKICLKQYLSEKMYRNHLERHGQEGLEHMPIEDANLPYECEHCGKRFRLKMNLTYHEFLHSGLKPFKCKLCPKSFRQPAHLRTHMIQHTGERRFKCEICNRAFVQPSLLRIHMRVHTGEKPYSCPVCEKAFHDLNVMRKHQKRHIMQMDS